MPVIVDTKGIEEFENWFELFPKRTAQALSLAINDTVRKVLLPEARKHIYAELNYPQGYLDDDRLFVDQFSTPTMLQAVVRGRDRPTSLRQFAVAGVAPTKRGEWIPVGSVTVHPGQPRQMPNAFLISLRRGDSPTGNVGLAIKLRPGEKVKNVREFNPIEIFPNVFILYGPSVDQAFENVASDIKPEVLDYLQTQFYRQFERLG